VNPINDQNHQTPISSKEIWTGLAAFGGFSFAGIILGVIVSATLASSGLAEMLSPALPAIGFLLVLGGCTCVGGYLCVSMFGTFRNNAALLAQGHSNQLQGEAAKSMMQAYNQLPSDVRRSVAPPALASMIYKVNGKVVNPDVHNVQVHKQPLALRPGLSLTNVGIPASEMRRPEVVESDEIVLVEPTRVPTEVVVRSGPEVGIVDESRTDLEARRMALANMIDSMVRSANPSVSRIRIRLDGSGLIRSNADITAAQQILAERGDIGKSNDGKTTRWLWKDRQTGQLVDYGTNRD